VLLLTTRGRRSGLLRTVPPQYFSDDHAMVVVAANGGMPNHPGWYFNLKADPDAGVEIYNSVREPDEQRPEIDGRKIAVRAEELSAEEAAVLSAGTRDRAAIRQVAELDRSRHPAPTARPGTEPRPEHVT
jgi:deazaflavin-dependent oxidoreductase (nitroreductase family)